MDCVSNVNDQLFPLHVTVPNLLKQLQIALMLSVSSATCESSFSSLKGVRHSTMSDEHLTNLALLTIEKDLTSTLPLGDIP